MIMIIAMNINTGGYDMKNDIMVMMQGFYGNRTMTEITDDESLDRLLQGWTIKPPIPLDYEMDRTYIHVPKNDNIVFIYNKHVEENDLKSGMKATVNIPEMDITLHCKVIACRCESDGKLSDLLPEDIKTVEKYFLA